jgi:tRNA nucleotidyltransferase (CCA-adding enzyme)
MQTFGVGPCAEIGIIKSQIKESILEGTIPNDYEAAFSEMLRIGKELGLEVKG